MFTRAQRRAAVVPDTLIVAPRYVADADLGSMSPESLSSMSRFEMIRDFCVLHDVPTCLAYVPAELSSLCSVFGVRARRMTSSAKQQASPCWGSSKRELNDSEKGSINISKSRRLRGSPWGPPRSPSLFGGLLGLEDIGGVEMLTSGPEAMADAFLEEA